MSETKVALIVFGAISLSLVGALIYSVGRRQITRFHLKLNFWKGGELHFQSTPPASGKEVDQEVKE